MNINDKYVKLVCEKIERKNEDGFELFLFNQDTNKGFLVNGVAAEICLKLDGSKKFEEILFEISEQKKIDLKKFTNELSAFKEDLIIFTLIEILEK